jgi:hypothetical protein
VGANGTYPTSGWAELIVVLRYSDSNQTEFHHVPCTNGKPWFSFSNTNGCYMGKGDRHDATAAYFTKYGVYFNTTGQFSAGSATAVYIYGRKLLW